MNILEIQQQIIDKLGRISELLTVEEAVASRRRELESEVMELKIKLENHADAREE